MESRPRFDFMSSMFVIGFGIGSFLGVTVALIFVALARGSDASPSNDASLIVVTATPVPSGAIPATPVQLPRTKAALDVYLGPGEAYAIIGVVSRGQEVAVVGRDASAAWAAIRFPPESTGRGWVPASQLDGLTSFDRMAVVAPTPLPRTVTTPPVFSGGGPGVDFPGSSTPGATGTPGTPVPGSTTVPANATPSATPRSGASDLLVIGMQLLPDGRVSITIGNRGPGDMIGGFQVLVSDNAGHNETITANAGRILYVGATTTIVTTSVVIRGPVEVSAAIDPFDALADPEPANDIYRTPMAPPPTVTPTPA